MKKTRYTEEQIAFALTAYPSRPLHRYVMKAHTKCSMPK
jgi:hypothetical protein